MKKPRKTQKAIKFLRDDEEPQIHSRRIESGINDKLPEGCIIFPPMTVLDKPAPIKAKRKGK